MGAPIVTLATALPGGGAERIAVQLHEGFAARGHGTALVVGRAAPGSPPHIVLRDAASPIRRAAFALGDDLVKKGKPGIIAARTVKSLASPRWMLDKLQGREEFEFPETHRLPDLLPARPRLFHAHNLHGSWFDLRALSSLARVAPVFVTLHDEWLLTGHCAYSLGCERWRSGCGACPDLTIYPAIGRDRTRENLQEKQSILADARVHVAAPAEWLVERVKSSPLGRNVASVRCIPNGVDGEVFFPGDRVEARSRLGLPTDVPIIAFVAADTSNRFKDPQTLRLAIERLGRAGTRLVALEIGGRGEAVELGAATWRPVPFVASRPALAVYYTAADAYVHSARAEVFPNTILEAMACALPVVAADVGGVAEQVRDDSRTITGDPTGVLVPPGDAAALASAIGRLLADPPRGRALGLAARRRVEAEFTLDRQVQRYLDWFGGDAGRVPETTR